MKKIIFLNFILLIHAISTYEKKISVVIASYNNEKYVENNLTSVFNQNYSNFRIFYLNDSSTDKTEEKVLDLVKKHNFKEKFNYFKRSKRCGALANRYNASLLADDDEIVVLLDGDDWLAHENVLSRINFEYQNTDVWCTYGQFKFSSSGTIGICVPLDKKIINSNSFRDNIWVTSHMRTFYAGLMKRIKISDLFFKGLFFPMTGDLAEMIPILEMSGKHIRFINDIIYVYNNENPINDHLLDNSFQVELEKNIRIREKYKPLQKLNHNKEKIKLGLFIKKGTFKKENINELLTKSIEQIFYYESEEEALNIINANDLDYIFFINDQKYIKNINDYIDILELTKADAYYLDTINSLQYYEILINNKTCLEDIIIFNPLKNNLTYSTENNLLIRKDLFTRKEINHENIIFISNIS